MTHAPTELARPLREFGQEHVLTWWDRLSEPERAELAAQLGTLDLAQLRTLYERRDEAYEAPASERIRPAPVIELGADEAEARRAGEEALRQGQVAVILVAGGQGSRLGFDHPKGLFPVGPVSDKSLFQIHFEKVLALRKRYGRPVPLLVMTSPATDAETREYLEGKDYFALPAEEVFPFCQGTMPALDRETGRLLMEAPGRLFLSPNGHGGVLGALADSGLLQRLKDTGIREVFYFQVDNPLVKVADPAFLGHHRRRRADVSCKIVPKEGPTDRLGNVALVDGRTTIIEYSDLPEELARQTDASGRLRLWAGSPAIHVFDVGFLERMAAGGVRIPFHVARKKVPYLGSDGRLVKPEKENALKFEMFIFDVLPLAERCAIVEASRREEFMPLKNATGSDSPETVRQAQSDVAGDWLEKAGVQVPWKEGRHAAALLEISPLYALDAEELAERLRQRPDGLTIEGPTYLE